MLHKYYVKYFYYFQVVSHNKHKFYTLLIYVIDNISLIVELFNTKRKINYSSQRLAII